jgi:membrane protein YqaA with SNARE-associated domain
MSDLVAYSGLFLSALIAATILPLQSEAVLTALLVAGDQSAFLLLTVASVGNVLGAVINWAIGRSLDKLRGRFWTKQDPKALIRATEWYHRWGKWSLLLSWAPFIGDPLTVVAGVLREPILPFLIIVTIAKTGRYIALYLLLLGLI